MSLILRHDLKAEADGCIVTLFLDPQTTEFSQELDGKNPLENKSFMEQVQGYLRKNFPEDNIKLIKFVVGSVVVASLSFTGVSAATTATAATTTQATTNYTVSPGDSLWGLSGKFGVSVSDIRTVNNLTSDTIFIGQILKIPQKTTTVTAAPTTTTAATYTVASGDSLYLIAKRFNTTVTSLKSLNNLTTETIYIGQVLKIPAAVPTTPTVPTSNYTVVSGDSLWIISRKFSTTVDELRRLNALTSDNLTIGQILRVPASAAPTPAPTPALTPTTSTAAPTITYITHKVASGENAWNISIRYGIPMAELLSVNGFTQSTMLSIGQEIKVPVHNVPIRPTLGPQYGERLDWWTEAQYVLPINKQARVTDFATGRSFYIKRTIGANHADSEPLTAEDSRIIREIWGGSFSWTARAVIVEVDGRKLAASMSSMPHDIEYIADNNFDGHFDLHFYNSTRHKDGLIDPSHQTQINIAAGYIQR